MSFLNSIIDVVVVAMGVTLNSKLQHSELSSPCALFKTRVCRVAEGDVTRCRSSIGVYACKAVRQTTCVYSQLSCMLR